MKKNIFISLSIIICTFFQSVFAQKNTIYFGVGPSFPLGDFAKTDMLNGENGAAITDYVLSLGYGRQFSRINSFKFVLTRKTYKLNESTYSKYTPIGAEPPFVIESDPWEITSILSGISQTISLDKSKRLKLEFRELIGLQLTKSPPLFARFTKVYDDPATSFTFSVGTALKCYFTDSFGLRFAVNLQHAKASFGKGEAITEHQKITTADGAVGFFIDF